jgi:uncharacterized protein (TIGR02145 family)
MNKLALLFVFVQSLVFANNPVITLNGDSVVELYLNTYYDDPGATAFDAEDGDLSDSIVVTGTYNGSSVGSYVLAYSVTDSDGNETVKNRIINVVQEYREGFEISATHSSTDENGNGVLDVSDTILFSITLENTGNSFLGGYFNSYNLVNFNGNNLSLNEFQWGSYDLNVGTTLIYSAEYTISESTADSGGIEFSVTSIANQLTVTSNTLRIPFASTSDEIILDGQISANNNQIKKVADPTDNLDAVNKRYVDQRTLEQTIPGQNIGDLLYWNGQSWQKLSAPQEQSTLRFCEGQLTWGPCKVDLFVDQPKEQFYFDDFSLVYNILHYGKHPLNMGVIISPTNQNPNEQDDTVLISTRSVTDIYFYYMDSYYSSGPQFEIQPGKTYYVKLFADNANNLGRSYSDVVTVSTKFKDQNGNSFSSKTYGNQEWSTQNARVTTYRDGTPIPKVDYNDHNTFYYATTGVYMQTDYGNFYNWYAIMGIHDDDPSTPNKHFAPEGWHVPSLAEWETLRDYLIANGYNYDGTTTGNKIAKAMASNSESWSNDDSLGAVGNNQSLNNASGFNAGPDGEISADGVYFNYGISATFWTRTYDFNNYGQFFSLNYNSPSLNMNTSYLFGRGHFVRFVKD